MATMSLHPAFASKDRRLAARFVPKGYRRVLSKADGVSCVYVGESAGASGERFYALAYRGSAGRPEFHYSYRDRATRDAKVRAFLASVSDAVETRAKRRADKSAWTNPLKAGDVLYTSWGYDQTNVEFFVVTRVSGKRVWVREIAQEADYDGDMTGRCKPAQPITFASGSEETMHTARPAFDTGAAVRISDSRTAYQWDGRPKSFSNYA